MRPVEVRRCRDAARTVDVTPPPGAQARIAAGEAEWMGVRDAVATWVAEATGVGLAAPTLRSWAAAIIWAATRGPGATHDRHAADHLLTRSPRLAAAVDRLDDGPGPHLELSQWRYHRGIVRIGGTDLAAIMAAGPGALAAAIVDADCRTERCMDLRRRCRRGEHRAALRGQAGAVLHPGEYGPTRSHRRAFLFSGALTTSAGIDADDATCPAAGDVPGPDPDTDPDPPAMSTDVDRLAAPTRCGQSPGAVCRRPIGVMEAAPV